MKRKGYVQCGVSDGLPGFSYADAKGRFKGLDVDICRALAAALFGDAEKVRFTPLSATERFSALQSGTVDLLSRNTSWTSSRDTALGIHFTGVTYFDGQGFLVNRKLGVSSARELKDATVCIQSGTTNELNVADYFRAHGIRYKAVLDDSYEKSARALEAGQCDVLSSDQSQLYAQRLKLAKPEQYVVLPEVISKEPLGPAVRQGDESLVQHRPLDPVRPAQRGGSWASPRATSSARPGTAATRTSPVCSAARATPARTCNCRATGWCRWCARSATMARSSPATSATAAR
ncbi:putative amino acid-binding protein [Pseudomonas aeruginosa]|nr:putative amino acid-binding protein [Pseudomonas aeruginosa]